MLGQERPEFPGGQPEALEVGLGSHGRGAETVLREECDLAEPVAWAEFPYLATTDVDGRRALEDDEEPDARLTLVDGATAGTEGSVLQEPGKLLERASIETGEQGDLGEHIGSGDGRHRRDTTCGPIAGTRHSGPRPTGDTITRMDGPDLELRNLTYRRFVESGRAPTALELAAETGMPIDDLRASWRRLHEAHAIVLDPSMTEIRMANPFSAVPTPHRVEAAGRSWFANCGWDAFGIGAALLVDSVIESFCPDCEAPLRVTVTDGRPEDRDLVFHVLVPAATWWADIGYT